GHAGRKTREGAARALQRRRGARAPIVPSRSEALGETLKALARHVRHQGVTVAEMAVGCGWADAGLPGRLGKCEAGGTFLRNEVESGADKGLAQVAMMVAAASAAAVSGPAHGRRFSAFGARRHQLAAVCLISRARNQKAIETR